MTFESSPARDLVKAFGRALAELRSLTPGRSPLMLSRSLPNSLPRLMQLGWRAVIERPDWKQQGAPKGSLDPEVWAAIKAGDWETLRRLQGTTSTVPTPRTAPEETSNEED